MPATTHEFPDEQTLHEAFTHMDRNGSHSESALAKLWWYADLDNRTRILVAFGHMIKPHYERAQEEEVRSHGV